MLVCPFLLKLPLNLVKNEAQRMIVKSGPACPVFSRYISSKDSVKNEGPIGKNQKYIHTNVTEEVNNLKIDIENLPQHDEIHDLRQPNIVLDNVLNQTNRKTNIIAEVESSQYLPNNQTLTKSKVANSFNYQKFFQDEIAKKKSDNTYRVFKKVLRRADNFPYAREKSIKNKDVAVWCSNDYLGMSWHPQVMEASINAIRKFGTGSGGTRNISGNTILHESLEEDLARLHGKQAGLVFSSCYVANEASLHTIGSRLPGLEIFSDSGNHASMIHGIRTSRVKKTIYRHNDTDHLDALLSRISPDAPKLVAFETVHSMSGNICPVEDLLNVCEKHGAFSFVDEVHAVGLYGDHGGGVAEKAGVMDRIDLISGTLGKAFGNFGGYVVGDSDVIDMIRSYASGFIFTTSLPPHVLAAARKAIDILASDEGRRLRTKHQNVVRTVKTMLQNEGIPVIDCPSHIIPVHVGHPGLCTHLSNELLHKHNIYVQSINHPTVEMGKERLRIAPSPHHTLPLIQDLVYAMVKLWKENNLPLVNQNNDRLSVAAKF